MRSLVCVNIDGHLTFFHRRIKDKYGVTALDSLPIDDLQTRGLIRREQAKASISADDIASGQSVLSVPRSVTPLTMSEYR